MFISFHFSQYLVTLVSFTDNCWPRKSALQTDFNINPHVIILKWHMDGNSKNESRLPRNEESRRNWVRYKEMRRKLLNRLARAGLVIPIDLFNGRNNHREKDL